MIITKKILLKTTGLIITGLLIFSSPLLIAEKSQHSDEHGHDEKDESSNKDGEKSGHKEGGTKDEHGHDEEKEEAASDVELSKNQMKQAGIETLRVKMQAIEKQISSLGEVRLNQYRTIQVSPNITTQVEKRHVQLGDEVKKGDVLVTLHTISTPDMSANQSADTLSRAGLNASITATIADVEANIAQAKGELAIATETWNRFRVLGKDAVSGKRYTMARITQEQAAEKLKAYQNSRAKISRVGKLRNSLKLTEKHYTLKAEQGGIIIKDDFVLGQIVNPGDVLFVISDMNQLWVETNIKPNEAKKIALGSLASIISEDKTAQGTVINIGRVFDEKTRTLSVRIKMNSGGATYYPGQYVKTLINSKLTQQAIAVPTEAILRSSDGDWMLFVEQAPGRFVPQEVEIVQNLGDKVSVKGIESGTSIVSKGAFFVQSELAKSGFSVHNH